MQLDSLVDKIKKIKHRMGVKMGKKNTPGQRQTSADALGGVGVWV